MPTNSLADRFEIASTVRKYRSILLVAGPHGTGKTSFALSGPSPHVVFSWDQGTEGIVEDFIERGKEIYVVEYDWSPGGKEFSQQQAVELRDKFESDQVYALNAGARLLTMDKEGDLWELYRYAEFGKPNDAPKDYAKLNQRYKAMLDRPKAYDTSVVLIDGVADDWGMVGGKLGKKGTQSRRGFDRLGEAVFGELEFRREAGEFYIDVGKCRQNTGLQDQTFTKADVPDVDPEDPNSRLDFGGFGQLLIQGSKREDWV